MAQYLQINDTLISYSLGDNLTSPSKVLFLVSDTQFSESERWFTIEYAYNYDQPIGDTQTIQLPFVAEIENKFYYSLPWRTIKFIDSTTPGEGAETPTPSPSPTTTITPTFFEEEPLGEYIYDSMEAVSITGGPDGGSVVGYNDRSLTTIQGVNGVTGLSIDNNIVTLTEHGRYYLKARSDAYMSEYIFTSIKFLSGDYADQNFDGPTRWESATSGDMVVTENSVVVDITQTTTFKIQTNVTTAKSSSGLNHGGATLFVQKLANADGGGSSSNGSSFLTEEQRCTILHLQSDHGDSDHRIKDYSIRNETLAVGTGVTHSTEVPSVYGGSSIKLDGTANSYITIPTSSGQTYNSHITGTSDFTVELYFKRKIISSNKFGILGQVHSSGVNSGTSFTVSLETDGKIKVYSYVSGNVSGNTYSGGLAILNSDTSLTDTDWYHIAVTRTGADFKLFINGVEEDTLDVGADRFGITQVTSQFYVNMGFASWNSFVSAYIQDLRIVSGLSVYSENFTPRTDLIPRLGSSSSTGSSSSASSTFASLTDTPSELSADKYLKVNTEGTALELVDAPVGSGGGSSSSGGSSNFYGANIFLTQGTLAIKSQTSDFIESIIMVGNTNNFDITFKDGIFTEPPIMVSTAVNTSDNYLEGVLVKSDASSGDLYASGKKMTIRWELTSAIRSYMTTAIDGVGANLVFMKTGADFDAGSSSGGSPAGSGGGSSGGAGSLQVIKDKSNFYTDLPDAIVWPHSPVSTEAADRSEAILHLKYVHEPHPTNGVVIDIFYECRDVNQGGVFLGFGFNNNSNGDYAHLYSSIAHFQDIPSATNSLKWFIENNRAIYYGGGSGSTSTFSLSNKTKEVLVDTSTTSITESSEETSSGFSNPPYKVFHNGYEFFLVSHTQDYIKYQGLDADDLIHTIFFENDEMGTLKSVSDDNNTVFFVGVSDLKIMIDNGNCEYLDSQ